jgi:hypothetical protein
MELTKKFIQEYLNIEPKNGGSYFFEEERTFRPNWITGVHIQKSRLLFNPHDTWVKIEYFIEGKWEKFFEGSVETTEEFISVIKMVGFKDL